MTFNAWHEPVPQRIVEAWLLSLLDESRDRAALLHALHERVLKADVPFEMHGARVVEPWRIQERLAEHVNTMAGRLAALSF